MTPLSAVIRRSFLALINVISIYHMRKIVNILNENGSTDVAINVYIIFILSEGIFNILSK